MRNPPVAAVSRLPSGRHKLSPQAVESNQRRRILAAMAAALEEHGYARATVAHVIELAGVSRRTFYEQFADKDDCLLAAYEDAEQRAWAQSAAAAATVPAGDWPRRVHAALAAALDFCVAASLKHDLTTAQVGALRAEGDHAFILYYGAHGTDYFMPMAREGGSRKVAALAASALP